jgi:hypothetical protein
MLHYALRSTWHCASDCSAEVVAFKNDVIAVFDLPNGCPGGFHLPRRNDSGAKFSAGESSPPDTTTR